MKCPKCGVEMNDLSSFCVECGTLNPKFFPPEKYGSPEPPPSPPQETISQITNEATPTNNNATSPIINDTNQTATQTPPPVYNGASKSETAHPRFQIESTPKKSKKAKPYAPNSQTKMLSMVVLFAFLVSAVGLCMPMVTINIFGARHASGLNILKRAFKTFDTPEVFMLFSLILTVVGLCFSLYSLKNRTAFSAILITSALAAIFLLLTLSDYMDYIGSGFILFEIAQCLIIVLSIVALYSSNKNQNES